MSVLSFLHRRRGKLPPDRTEEILAPYFDQDFRAYPMASAAASSEQFRALEEKLGIQYPPEFIAHVLGRFPGLYLEVKEEVWPRPKAGEAGPFWSFLYAFHTYTSVRESEPWMRLEWAAQVFAADEPASCAAAILKVVGDADLYCATPEGGIVRFDHETGELRAFEGDFWTLLEREIRELYQRKERKKAGAPG